MDRSQRLIGFHICPFVQKARIAFALKGLDVPIEYIDLARKPRWFLEADVRSDGVAVQPMTALSPN